MSGTKLLAGRVAIVTGGALGMGRASAFRLAEEGAKVCVVDIDGAGAETVATRIRDKGGEAFACKADISSEADNDRMVEETVKRYGGVDIGHLNAALLGRYCGFFEHSVEEFDRIIAVNLRGAYLGLRSIGRVIRPEGSVIVMASIAGLSGWGFNVPYSTSKHGVIAIAKGAASAYGEKRARVNVICPGTVHTRMYVADAAEDAIIPAEELKTPEFAGMALPQHIAEVVVFLASSRSSFINGAVHTVDGGRMSDVLSVHTSKASTEAAKAASEAADRLRN